jgi:Fe-S cluster biosynthesis and repair protein YggX
MAALKPIKEGKNNMARFEKTITLVNCAKLGEELPALERPPFPGELGERIYEDISKMAWEMWQQQATLIINHYALNMADPRSHDFLMEQMDEFFFGGQAQMPEGWAPQGGKGAPRK